MSSNKQDLFFGNDFDPTSNEPINFIENRFSDLSPFSAHEVEIDSVLYKTAEHAYQALRVIPALRKEIMQARSPLDAWRLGQDCKEAGKLIENVDKDALMERIFRAKLAQHKDIESVLRATGDRELLKVYEADSYWGTGSNGTGQNKMGVLWMKLRAELI